MDHLIDGFLVLAGVIVGALLQYLSTRRHAEQELVRRRSSLATALLFELQSAEQILAKLVAKGGKGQMAEGSVSVFERFPDRAELFDAATVATVLNFRQRILSLYQESHDRRADRSAEQRHRIVRGFSVTFLSEIPAVRQVLLAAGGVLPPATQPIEELRQESPPARAPAGE